MDDKVKELNLLLLYLTGWEEDSRDNPGEKVFRSWKGYPFKVLNELESEKLIRQLGQKNPLILTETGRAEAEKLKERFFAT